MEQDILNQKFIFDTDRQTKIIKAFVALAGLSLIEDGDRFKKVGFSVCHAALGCGNNKCPVVEEGLKITDELLEEWKQAKLINADRYLEWL